jgi:hypothetical protein
VSSYDDIAACAANYSAAWTELTQDETDALRYYETVLRARVALAECLIHAGWTPPDEATQLLSIDRQLLAEPHGVVEDMTQDIVIAADLSND